MPLDWGDYWRDTGHLKAAEHGAYLNLLGHYWVSGKPLPDDDARLHRLAKTTAAEWKRLSAVVRAFFTARDGVLHHKRVDREIARATDVYAKRARGASLTNARKTHINTQSDTHSAPQSDAHSGAQSPSPDSVPDGTGADAPLGGRGVVETQSLKTRIFGPCLGWLVAQAKLPEAQARKITARWCAKHGDGAVLDAFTAAARQSPLDPVPYIEKVLNNGPTSTQKNRAGAAPSTHAARVAADARDQAAGHLSGLRAALGLGPVASVRSAAAGPDAGYVIDADRLADHIADPGQ